MRALPTIRTAVLGLALTGLTVSAQTPPPASTPPVRPTAPPVTAPPMPTVSPTAVAASVNGQPVYELVVQRALERVPPARRAEVRGTVIDHMVNNLLIDLSLKVAGYKVEPAEVDKRIADMKTELKKIGRDFDKMLAEMKVQEAELREHITTDLRWYKYASAQATDKALSDLFNGNKDMFDGTTVRAQHILMTPASKDPKVATATVAALREVRTKIEAEVNAALAKLPATTDALTREKERTRLLSETFGKYAKEKSDCPSKANGGAVGPFPKIGFMVAPFSNTAFALQPFQMSDVVETPFGYHLILVTERKPGREIKFNDVKEMVKEVYFDRLHEGLSAQLRPKANIVVNPAPK
jgi:peptidyl-prolyl cis-trans isomerase C